MIKPFSDACFEKLKSTVLHCAEFYSDSFNTEVLKDLIIKKTGHEISVHALNKAFCLVPSRFKPSPYTLNVLAMYCGYADWDDFCIMNEK